MTAGMMRGCWHALPVALLLWALIIWALLEVTHG